MLFLNSSIGTTFVLGPILFILVDLNPSEKEDMKIPIEKEEMPVKRMRTRSMDIAEEESLYSMSRYRISPETIGILNSKGITQLFPIQVE